MASIDIETPVGAQAKVDAFRATRSSRVTWPTGLVAFWDFQGTDWLRTKAGQDFTLQQAPGSAVAASAKTGPFGPGIDFNGTTGVLRIASANVGALNVAKAGDAVTVGAWIERDDYSTTCFVAGCWLEGPTNPARNYAMFLDLPLYGGNDCVCGHVSRTGAPSPNITYSRDYSASARRIPSGKKHFVAFTYDGAQAISYIDGIADSYPAFTEPGAPDGEGLTLAKNPYAFDLGLNRTGVADFNVGGQLLTTGAYGNYMKGTMYGLFVFNRALTAVELMQINKQATDTGTGVLAEFDFWYNATTLSSESARIGWKSVLGATATNTTNDEPSRNFRTRAPNATRWSLNRSILTAANGTNIGMGYFDTTIAGLRLSEVSQVKFTLNNSLAADLVRLCVKVGSTWYATDATYSVTGDGRTETDYTTAETKTVTIERTATLWRDLTLTVGTALTLGAVRSTAIPNGDLTGIGFYTPAIAGEVRIKDLQILH